MSKILKREGDDKDLKDSTQDEASGQIEETTNVGNENVEDPTTELHPPSTSLKDTPTPQPTNILPTVSRLPCYGWIESDEEDADDFILSKPASAVVGDKATLPQELSKSERQRKSRWDQRPDEPLPRDLSKLERKRKSRWDQRPETLPRELSKPERKRRSRWDQKPDDPQWR
ncbi:hypothetical protein CDL12_02368 [Handroanthus impetiginosus]|uniref:Uncharacterized protein n=1 Tax=Handroanthus impetiginosus TaxID=429701 RepID=A0A2G9I562_9LAMI|nr:hypothetical protein CDL12_02368 [Handroanthus impetiginosus]